MIREMESDIMCDETKRILGGWSDNIKQQCFVRVSSFKLTIVINVNPLDHGNEGHNHKHVLYSSTSVKRWLRRSEK